MAADMMMAERVRQEDRDRYLTALFAPAARRDALLALYAFNLEIARIAELVSEPMIGEIRLAWWRESIAGLYAGMPRRHEVLDALGPVIAAHDLPEAEFQTVIDARAADLEDVPFATLDDLERYAEASAAPLMTLAARILGPWQPPAPLVAAAGAASALSGILRAVRFHAQAGRVLLPRDLLLAQGIDAHDLVNGQAGDDLRGVVRAVHGRAMARLGDFLAGAGTIPATARPAFLSLALVAADLKALAAADFDPFAPALSAPRPLRLWSLIRRGVFGW